MKALNRQIIPAIKEQFLGPNESASSALNQALAQSATDLSTALGTQYMDQYNQAQTNRINALGFLGSLAGQHTFQPVVQQRQGLAGPLLGTIGAIGGPMAGSYFGPSQARMF